MTSLELTYEVAKVLDEKKGIDIKAIKVQELTSIGDYFVIASGSSVPQVKALAEEVEAKLSRMGLEPKRVEGSQTASWILLDYYDVIVHVFLEEPREFYSLERLWSDAERVDLSKILTD